MHRSYPVHLCMPVVGTLNPACGARDLWLVLQDLLPAHLYHGCPLSQLRDAGFVPYLWLPQQVDVYTQGHEIISV